MQSSTWTTLLRNHRDGIAAMDIVSVPTAMFPALHVLLVIRHGRRVVRCAVTRNPIAVQPRVGSLHHRHAWRRAASPT